MKTVRFIHYVIILSGFAGCVYESAIYPDNNFGLSYYLTSQRDYGQLTLSWTPAYYAFPNGYSKTHTSQSAYFEILYSDSDPLDLKFHSRVKNNVFGLTIGQLENGKPYYFGIKAVGYNGNESWSNTIMTVPDIPCKVRNIFQSVDRNRISGTWSPDQSMIAYTGDSVWENGNQALSTIYTLELSTQIERPIINGQEPQWSPKSDELVFRSSMGESFPIPGNYRSHLFIFNLKDFTFRQLTRDSTFDLGPAWSPDGRWIAYLSDKAVGYEYNIWKIRPEGGETVQVSEDFDHLDIWDISNRSAHNLTWSPDGNYIGFTMRTDTERGYMNDIYRVSVITGIRELVHAAQWDDNSPAYSLDGLNLAFVSDRSGSSEIWILNFKNGKLKQVTSNPQLWVDVSSGKIEWSPSGDKIMFTSYFDLYSTIYIVEVN